MFDHIAFDREETKIKLQLPRNFDRMYMFYGFHYIIICTAYNTHVHIDVGAGYLFLLTNRGLPELFSKLPSRLSRLEELTCSARREMCAGVSSFGFGGTNSRADLWADVEKGPFKEPETLRSVATMGGGQWGSTANYVMNARVRMNIVPY